jgi:hypothetical protein
MGWSIDWRLTDWLLPAGAWSHLGTAIEACTAIAGAAGGYIQSHRTDQALIVRPRYPSAPWAWSAAVPDIVLPESVCAVEGIEWIEKPRYNSVFVSGMADGIIGHVTRAGTAGDRVAPMVTDALITSSDAARQRGMTILSDTGAQAHISLGLPVLPEFGVIEPGLLVSYTEGGGTHLGISRKVEVSADFPRVRQTVVLECHEL